MTRTGKIARLPISIRDQLNRRLLDNEPGPSILDWLNSLSEVQALLAAEFASQPVSPANLSQWKNGGYRDWLTRRDALALAHDLEDKEALGDDSLAGIFADKLARWLSLHYASVALRTLAAEDPDNDPDTRQRRLRQLCADVTRLQRQGHEAQRIGLERERIQIQLSNAEWQRKKDLHDAEMRALNLQSLRDALACPAVLSAIARSAAAEAPAKAGHPTLDTRPFNQL
jgi:hypothetical protein